MNKVDLKCKPSFKYKKAVCILKRKNTGLYRPTASIALQGAIHSEYIPFLSRVLLAEEVLKHPIHSVIRKGKGHYVCPKRLQQRLERIDREKKNPKNLSALLALQEELDMDGVRGLSGYDRRQVQVSRTCHCSEEGCRYKEFVAESNSSNIGIASMILCADCFR